MKKQLLCNKCKSPIVEISFFGNPDYIVGEIYLTCPKDNCDGWVSLD